MIAEVTAFSVPRWWLTFYVRSDPIRLVVLGARLSELRGINTGGADSGFLYPKLEVCSDPATVAGLVSEVQRLALEAGVEVLSVDVDTSFDVERSVFKELIRLDGNSG